MPLLAARILKGVKLVFLILLQPQWAFRGTMAFSLHFVVFCLEACLKHPPPLTLEYLGRSKARNF